MHQSGEIWAAIGHPVAPDKLAFAVGSKGSTFADHGMHWDNSDQLVELADAARRSLDLCRGGALAP